MKKKTALFRISALIFAGSGLWLCLSALLYSFQSFATETASKESAAVSDGTRIYLKKKGFSIAPPKGWEIHTDYPNLSLLMQPPFKNGLMYQRTIQVMIFKGARYIDDITSREFEHNLIEKYSKMSQSIDDYKVRNHLLTRMSDGREGILYYTEFSLDTKKMMQAHILVSSDKHSYLITYTDQADHFEGKNAANFLTKAWESMTSIKLAGDAPVRFQKLFLMGLTAIGILIFLIIFYLIRSSKALKTYSDHADRDEDEEEIGSQINSSAHQLTHAGRSRKESPAMSREKSRRKNSSDSTASSLLVSHDDWSLGEDSPDENSQITGYNANTERKRPSHDDADDEDDPWGQGSGSEGSA